MPFVVRHSDGLVYAEQVVEDPDISPWKRNPELWTVYQYKELAAKAAAKAVYAYDIAPGEVSVVDLAEIDNPPVDGEAATTESRTTSDTADEGVTATAPAQTQAAVTSLTSDAYKAGYTAALTEQTRQKALKKARRKIYFRVACDKTGWLSVGASIAAALLEKPIELKIGYFAVLLVVGICLLGASILA